MKVITEAVLRNELRSEIPENYIIPEGKILSPAAREYLQQHKVKILDGKKKQASVPEKQAEEPKVTAPSPQQPEQRKAREEAEEEAQPQVKPKYRDYDTGAYYFEKPEHMTQLFDNYLVAKDHKRIYFRGKLDSLASLFIVNQTLLEELGEPQALVEDLQDILASVREIMRCDVLDLPFRRDYMIGLSHKELRDHSHHPMKYYKIKQMLLPDHSMGKAYALLNQLRSSVRETEVAAATAFHEGKAYNREDIIEELNRMSSAMHILMCKYLAGVYKENQ